MLNKTLFLAILFFTPLASAEEADFSIAADTGIESGLLHRIELAPQTAHSELRQAYAGHNEPRILELLTKEQNLLLQTKEGSDLALIAAFQYGTLDQARQLFKDAGMSWRLNKESLSAPIIYLMSLVRKNVTQPDPVQLYFNLLTAATKHTDQQTALTLTHDMFAWSLSPIWIGASFNTASISNVLEIASTHNDKVLMNNLFNKWCSIDISMYYCDKAIDILFSVMQIPPMLHSICTRPVNDTYVYIVLCTVSVAFLINKFVKIYRSPPIQWHNKLFAKAACLEHFGVMDYVLDIPRGLSLPTEKTLITAYKDISENIYGLDTVPPIMDRLETFIPAYERQVREDPNAQTHEGLAYEIHNYAARTNGFVMRYINRKLAHHIPPLAVRAVDENRLKKRLNAFVENSYSNSRSSFLAQLTFSGEFTLAKKAVNAKWNPNTPIRLNKILFFLDTYYPNSIDQWMEGFVGESITAYKNSSNKLSCEAGIEQRMVTGLRSIDPGLDAIFSPTEVDFMIKAFFKNLNVSANPQKVANELTALSITLESSVEEASAAYNAHLHAEVKNKGGDSVRYEADIDAVLEIFDDEYEASIKPHLV